MKKQHFLGKQLDGKACQLCKYDLDFPCLPTNKHTLTYVYHTHPFPENQLTTDYMKILIYLYILIIYVLYQLHLNVLHDINYIILLFHLIIYVQSSEAYI